MRKRTLSLLITRKQTTYNDDDGDHDERDPSARAAGAELFSVLLPLVALLFGARQEPHEQAHEHHADRVQHQGVLGESPGPVGVLVVRDGGGVDAGAVGVGVGVAGHALEGGQQLRGDDAVHQQRRVAHGHEQLVGGGLLAGLGELDHGHGVEHLGQALGEGLRRGGAERTRIG